MPVASRENSSDSSTMAAKSAIDAAAMISCPSSDDGLARPPSAPAARGPATWRSGSRRRAAGCAPARRVDRPNPQAMASASDSAEADAGQRAGCGPRSRVRSSSSPARKSRKARPTTDRVFTTWSGWAQPEHRRADHDAEHDLDHHRRHPHPRHQAEGERGDERDRQHDGEAGERQIGHGTGLLRLAGVTSPHRASRYDADPWRSTTTTTRCWWLPCVPGDEAAFEWLVDRYHGVAAPAGAQLRRHRRRSPTRSCRRPGWPSIHGHRPVRAALHAQDLALPHPHEQGPHPWGPRAPHRALLVARRTTTSRSRVLDPTGSDPPTTPSGPATGPRPPTTVAGAAPRAAPGDRHPRRGPRRRRASCPPTSAR